MIRRPPRSTLSSSSAASDVYKRQGVQREQPGDVAAQPLGDPHGLVLVGVRQRDGELLTTEAAGDVVRAQPAPVSYTHLRAHETPEHLVCRLLLAKKKTPPT